MEPMHLEIAQETVYFLHSCLLGAVMGVVYDFFRVLRNTVRHNRVMVFAEDFLYSVIFGMSFFLFGTDLTGGIRGFILVGMISGCMLQRAVLGNWSVKLISKVTGFIWNILLAPFKVVFTRIVRIINKRIVKKCLIFFESKKKMKKPLKV